MSSPGMLDRDRCANPARQEESSRPANARRPPGDEGSGEADWAIAALRETIGLILIRDVRLDSGTCRLRCHDDAGGGIFNPRSFLLEPGDVRRLVAQAGPGRISIEAWLPLGGGGRFGLCLEDWQGGLAWRRGLITAPPPPQESVEMLGRHARLADMGMQMAVMAHELRQPLFAIAMAAENLRRMLEAAGEDAARPRVSAQRIAEQVGRAHEMIERTLRDAKGDAGQTGEEADAVQAARAAIDAINGGRGEDSVSVRIRLAAHVRRGPVPLSGLEVEQVFTNVLRNALESIQARRAAEGPAEGTIDVSIDAAGDRLVCVVEDNGLGIDRGACDKAGDPFFTTKAGTGTGLGLYVCRQILAKAGGGLEIGPRRQRGARVEFTMRLTEADAFTLPRAPGE